MTTPTEQLASKSDIDSLAKIVNDLRSSMDRNQLSLTVPEDAQQRTLSEVLVLVRSEAMQIERSRRMAVLGKDGELKERNTSTYRAYNVHWKMLEAAFGTRLIHTITSDEITSVTNQAAIRAIETSNIRRAKKETRGVATTPSNGSRARNMCIDAAKAIWLKAESIGATKSNPTGKIKRSRNSKSKRHGLTAFQLEELFDLAATGGNDPLLDHTILWTLSEAACRRGGIINLKLGDINRERQTITLYEKNDSDSEQPITLALLERLLAIANLRGSTKPSDPVFLQLPTARTDYSRRITGKVFDTLFARLKSEITWSRELDISAHWVRHTTLTFVERTFGAAVAQKYARHKGGNVTADYTDADIAEVAHALEVLTNTLHPLAQADPRFTNRDA